MQNLLTILGAAALLVLLFLVIGYFWIRSKWRKFAAELEALGENSGGGVPPFEITLRTENQPRWKHPDSMQGWQDALAALGYEPVGSYSIPEVKVARILAARNIPSGVFAVVYDHDQAGVFADLLCTYADGTSLTVSSSRETGMDRSPSARLIRMAETATEPIQILRALHERMVLENAGQAPAPVAGADFAALFVGHWAKEMDWRISRGGITAAEIREVARISGQPAPDDDAIELVQDQWREAICEHMDEKIRRLFTQQSKMPPAEWEKVRDRLHVVHAHSSVDYLIERVVSRLAGDDTDDSAEEKLRSRVQAAFAAAGSTRAGFAAAQRLLPENQREPLLGTVDTPCPADIYLAPEDTEGDDGDFDD